jgi:hypothetical protein
VAEGAEDTLRVACPVLGNSPARANFHALPSSLRRWLCRHVLLLDYRELYPVFSRWRSTAKSSTKKKGEHAFPVHCGLRIIRPRVCICSEMLCDSHVVSEDRKFSDCSIKVFRGCLTINLPCQP